MKNKAVSNAMREKAVELTELKNIALMGCLG